MVLALILGCIAVAVGLIWTITSRDKAFGLIILAVGMLAIGISCFRIIPPGHVGVPVVLGKIQNTYYPEGATLVNPLARVETFSIRTEPYEMTSRVGEGARQGDDSIDAYSKDNMKLPIDVTAFYRLNAADASIVFQKLGPDFIEKSFRSTARTSFRDAVRMYTAQEANASKRVELQADMNSLFKERLGAFLVGNGCPVSAIEVTDVQLRNVPLPADLLIKIGEKLGAQQEAERMEFVLDKERSEATRKAIEAQGIKNFQDIVSEGINDKLLVWKAIEATGNLKDSPNTKILIFGGGNSGIPTMLPLDFKTEKE